MSDYTPAEITLIERDLISLKFKDAMKNGTLLYADTSGVMIIDDTYRGFRNGEF